MSNIEKGLRRARAALHSIGGPGVAEVAPLSEAIYAELAAEIGAGELERLYRMLAHATASLGPPSRRTGTGDD